MVRIIGIIVIVTLVVSSAVYAYLGGFSKPALSQTQLPVYIIAGKAYQGKADTDTLQRIFDEAKQLHTDGRIRGTLAAAYYQTADEAKGNIKVWAGVLVSDSSVALPPGYLFRVFPSTHAVRAEIKAHFAVAPAPHEVKKQLRDFAKAQKLKPGGFVVEKYLNPREIVMEMPVAKTP